MLPVIAPIASQLICKFLYLFFPRDIQNTFCIVVKAVAQGCKKPGIESGGFGHSRGKDGVCEVEITSECSQRTVLPASPPPGAPRKDCDTSAYDKDDGFKVAVVC